MLTGGGSGRGTVVGAIRHAVLNEDLPFRHGILQNVGGKGGDRGYEGLQWLVPVAAAVRFFLWRYGLPQVASTGNCSTRKAALQDGTQ